MRIAFVVHDYNRTLGHSRYVAELAERFSHAHDVHVFASRFENLPPRIHAHKVPALRFSMLATIFSFVLPASLMIGRGFDIVHAQGLTILEPDIITAHISNARWLEGRRVLLGANLSWKERLFGALVIPAERRSLRDPRATVIAISTALQDDLRRLYDRTGDTVVIPHGVDLHQFNPSVRGQFRRSVRDELGLDEADIVFLYVGDLRKGFEPSIRALADVPGGRLLAVSRTPPQPYLALAAECGVSDRVTILPGTSQIEKYYGAVDALVLPTPYDAFGMVITEAMACGLPVVTTRLAGAAELLTDGADGLLIDSPADGPALAGAMRALAGSADLRDRIGAAAAESMQRHTWDHVAERTFAVYEQHLQRRAVRLDTRSSGA